MQASPLQFGFQKAYFFPDVTQVPSDFMTHFKALKEKPPSDDFVATAICISNDNHQPAPVIYGVSGPDTELAQIQTLDQTPLKGLKGVHVIEINETSQGEENKERLSPLQKAHFNLVALLEYMGILPIQASVH